MVLPWAPRMTSNSSNPCESLIHIHPPNYTLINACIGLLAFYGVVLFLSAILCYVWRDEPLFRKVRPVGLSWIVLIGIALDSTSSFGVVLHMPCPVIATIYILAQTIFATSIVARALVISLEAQFAKLALTAHQEWKTTASTHSEEKPVNILVSAILLTKIALGLADVDQTAVRDIKQLLRSYYVFIFLCACPGFFVIIILVTCVEAFHHCPLVCRQVFLEVPLAVFALTLFYLLFAIRCVRAAFLKVGWDDKLVIRELMLIPVVAGSIIIIVWSLVISDVGEAHLHRTFDFQILFGLSLAAYWWISFGDLFYRTLQRRRQEANRRLHHQTSDASHMSQRPLEAMKEDPALWAQFRNFAATQYISESVMFLEDITEFKAQYASQTDLWRKNKAKMLVRRYIEVDADLQVNISSSMREDITTKVQQSQDMDTLFDDAFEEIAHMLENGGWRDFLVRQTRTTGNVAVLSSSTDKL